MPAEAWTFHLPSTGQSAAAVPWARLREVEVHHVDLGAGYTPADWSDAFALRLLREIVGGRRRRTAAAGAAPARHRAPADHRRRPDAPVVGGPTRVDRGLAGRPRRRRRPDRLAGRRAADSSEVEVMTDYTGDVTPRRPAGGPRRWPSLTITKVSVGPMDNNAYLLRCRPTARRC